MFRRCSVMLACLSCLGSAAVASEAALPPALYSSLAEMLASVDGTQATNLTKGVRVVRAGDDRVSIDVLKRKAPEEGATIHSIVTEIYQVLAGGGTLETGGVVPDAKPLLGTDGGPLNPESIGPTVRGTSAIGAQLRKVAVGDIVVIPPGTPHRFVALDGQVTYLVIRFNPDWFASKDTAKFPK